MIRPFEGRVRIGQDSSLRKLMRAYRRDKVPSERMGIIKRAMESAKKRRSKYLSAHVRNAMRNINQ